MLYRRAYLWRRRHLGRIGGEGITVDKRMARSPSLDLTQTNEISSLEAASTVFELPQRRIR